MNALTSAVPQEAPGEQETDRHMSEVTRVLHVLREIQSPAETRQVLRALREVARDLVALHRVLVESVEITPEGGGLIEDEDGDEYSSSSSYKSVGRRRHVPVDDHHATIHAELRALLRWESELYKTPEPERRKRGLNSSMGMGPGVMGMPDAESFGWAALTQVTEAVRGVVSARAPSQEETLLRQLSMARAAKASPRVIKHLEQEIEKMVLPKEPT